MKIPMVNTISMDFLQPSSSFLLQIFSCSHQELISQVYENLWKWSAIFLATIACICTFPRIIKLLVPLNKPFKSGAAVPATSHTSDHSDLDDSDDETCSSISLSTEHDDQSDEEGDLPSPSVGHPQTDLDFRVAGASAGSSSQLRRRRSFADNLAEFCLGKSVVKLWDRSDSKLLRLQLQDANGDFLGKLRLIQAMPKSPAAVVSAGLNSLGKIALNVWDNRAGFRVPALSAEWEPKIGNGIVVGDARNLRSPWEEDITTSVVERWWDADE